MNSLFFVCGESPIEREMRLAENVDAVKQAHQSLSNIQTPFGPSNSNQSPVGPIADSKCAAGYVVRLK